MNNSEIGHQPGECEDADCYAHGDDFPQHTHAGDQLSPNDCVYTRLDGVRCPARRVVSYELDMSGSAFVTFADGERQAWPYGEVERFVEKQINAGEEAWL